MTIDFNYSQAISQANQIDTIADDMQSLANSQLQNALETLGGVWKGEASQLFVTYCNGTKGDILTQAQNLHNLASKIRSVAAILKNAEQAAEQAEVSRD
jgi:WXG100 family type VII secretion target